MEVIEDVPLTNARLFVPLASGLVTAAAVSPIMTILDLSMY